MIKRPGWLRAVSRRDARGDGDGPLPAGDRAPVVLALFVPLIISSGGNSLAGVDAGDPRHGLDRAPGRLVARNPTRAVLGMVLGSILAVIGLRHLSGSGCSVPGGTTCSCLTVAISDRCRHFGTWRVRCCPSSSAVSASTRQCVRPSCYARRWTGLVDLLFRRQRDHAWCAALTRGKPRASMSGTLGGADDEASSSSEEYGRLAILNVNRYRKVGSYAQTWQRNASQ
jgi:hypothetical protein